MLANAVDWTNVLVALIAGLPAIIAAIGVLFVRRDLKLPSGEKIGHVIERSHDLTAANTALLQRLNGIPTPDPKTLGEQAKDKK
jgi:hypothetical protein